MIFSFSRSIEKFLSDNITISNVVALILFVTICVQKGLMFKFLRTLLLIFVLDIGATKSCFLFPIANYTQTINSTFLYCHRHTLINSAFFSSFVRIFDMPFKFISEMPYCRLYRPSRRFAQRANRFAFNIIGNT